MMSEWPVLFHESTRILRLDSFHFAVPEIDRNRTNARSCSSRVDSSMMFHEFGWSTDGPRFFFREVETRLLDPDPTPAAGGCD